MDRRIFQLRSRAPATLCCDMVVKMEQYHQANFHIVDS